MLRFLSKLGVTATNGGTNGNGGGSVDAADFLDDQLRMYLSAFVRNAACTGAASSSRDRASAASAAWASDPGEWERRWDAIWAECDAILDATSGRVEPAYEQVQRVMFLTGELAELLLLEVCAQPEPAIGPLLDRLFTAQMLDRLLHWAINAPLFLHTTCQVWQMRLFEQLISGSAHTHTHCLLVHKPVLQPLLRLLAWCETSLDQPSASNPQYRKTFVLLLNQICSRMADDATLLWFVLGEGDQSQRCLVFSLLVRFLYAEGDVGQLARDAALFLLNVTARSEQLADYISTKSDLCPVLATGLSGAYSQLARVLSGWGGHQEALELMSPSAASALADFHGALLFANAVAQTAHPTVARTLASYFYSGFLLSVVRPSILQEEEEAAAAASGYVELCVDVLTDSGLAQQLARLILLPVGGQQPLLRTVVARTRTPNKLGTASLSLLRSLVEKGWEDVLLALLFVPAVRKRGSIRKSAVAFRTPASHVAVAHRLFEAAPTSAMAAVRQANSPWAASPEDRLAPYLHDARISCRRALLQWAQHVYPYDAINPPIGVLGDVTDDETDAELRASGGFARMSSARSSLSSARFGLNRYGVSRRTTLLTEAGDVILRPLGPLGYDGSASTATTPGIFPDLLESFAIATAAEKAQNDARRNGGADSLDEEDEQDVVLPPISSAMMSSSVYLQLTTFDDLSDSDEPAGGGISTNTVTVTNGKSETVKAKTKDEISDEPREKEVVVPYERAFTEDYDADEFLTKLRSESDRIGGPSGDISIAECTSFIDAKCQFLDELVAEKALPPLEEENFDEPSEKVSVSSPPPTIGVPIAQLIEHADEDDFVVDLLIAHVQELAACPLPFALAVCHILVSFASLPHPLLTAYLFGDTRRDSERLLIGDSDADTSGFSLNLLEALERTRFTVDAWAASVGPQAWEMSVERAVRTLTARAERMDEARERGPGGASPGSLAAGSIDRSSTAVPGGRAHFRLTSTSVGGQEGAGAPVAGSLGSWTQRGTAAAAVLLVLLCEQLAAVQLVKSARSLDHPKKA